MSTIELPAEFANVTSLGRVEAVFRASAPSMKGKFTSWLIATVAVGIIFAIGYFGESALKRRDMEMVAVGAQMIGMFGLVVVGGVWFALLVALWLISLLLFARSQTVAIYSGGIANSEKGKIQAWAFEDIREIYAYFFADTATSDTGFGARFDIYNRSGDYFTINHFLNGWEEVMEKVKQNVYARIDPEIKKSLEAGETIPFGKDLVVEKDGFRVAKKLTAWDALTEHRLAQGMLILGVQKGSPAQIPIPSIPNLELLRALLDKKLAKAN